MSEDTLLTTEDGLPLGLLDAHVESFLKHLRAAGYAERTVRKKRPIARSFTRWTGRKQIMLQDLSEFDVDAFVGRLSPRRKARIGFERAVLRLFLRYLRLEARVPAPPLRSESSPADNLQRRYVDYLRDERGLAKNSICVYSLYIHDFLTELEAESGSVSPGRLDAQAVQDFLLDRIRDRSSEWSRLLATALRSFLRFLYLRVPS
jgi:site-specific recombinase XerD